MQKMNTMKYYGIMQKVGKNSMILLFMVLVFSCRNDNQTKIYYYTKNCTSCDLSEYQAKRFRKQKDTIYMDIFVYREGKVHLVNGGIYLQKNNSVYRFESRNDRVGQCYLKLQKDTCIYFNMSDPRLNPVLKTRYRYIETTNAMINGEKLQVYKFECARGASEIVYNVYFSRDFIPLKEEYVSGAVLKCDLELINDSEVPRDFKMQVENWEKRKDN